MTNGTVLVSRRFLRAYRKAVGLRGRAEEEARELVRRRASLPVLWKHDYDRIAGLKDEVLEVDLAGGARMLVHPLGRDVLLLDLGGHNVPKLMTQQILKAGIASAQPAPRQFLSETGTFFSSSPDRSVSIYGNEIAREWIYFLDNEQTQIADAVLDRFLEDYGKPRTDPSVEFLLGGPGTGKTAVLVNLAARLVDDLGAGVHLRVLERVGEYLSCSLRIDVEGLAQEPTEDQEVDVILLDDPASLDAVNYWVNLAENLQIPLVVAGWDPLQMSKSVTDKQHAELKEALNAREHLLTHCYRQKKNVGVAAKKTIDSVASSTPFLDQGKIQHYREERQWLTEAGNSVLYPNPAGYVEVYEGPTLDQIQAEVHRIGERPELLWTHWPPLLVVLDRFEGVEGAIARSLKRIRHDQVALSDTRLIKGLEYQHVFIFIQSDLYSEIEYGFTGSGRRIYEARRLLRIPFTRAKDSVVTFVFSPDDE